ncbi:type VII secretion target [Actinoplanes sp. NPDC051513]|uniref:type VII secretion target n=1 Tax=Actinoplanes sp. NPDC051513 TaxID=3363908 RepID=UPI0037A3D77F
MSDQLSVRHTELVTHAGHVEAIADRLTTAAGAGRAVRADNGAYGQLCVMVPAMLNVLHDILVDGLDECAESLRDTGAKLRTTASEYDSSDTFSANSIKSAG